MESKLYISKDGSLCEDINLGEGDLTFYINGLAEHIIFGIYFRLYF